MPKPNVMPENVRCYETECHAGLDPASFPEKAVEKDTGSLNQVQGRQARCDSTFGNVDFVY